MARLINAYPWHNSSLGTIEVWPPELHNAVSTMLESRIPMYVAWGEEFIQFYNDAYVPILGAKGDDEIGKSTRETWPEIWPVIGPMFRKVLREGESFGFPGFNLFLERGSYTEETYFDFSYSPIRKIDRTIGGVFLSCLETTDRVLHERRMEMLANTLPVAFDSTAAGDFLKESHLQLSHNPKDLPYSLFIEYNIEKEAFSCLSKFGLSNSDPQIKGFLSAEGVHIIRNLSEEGVFESQKILKNGVQFDLKPWQEDPTFCYIIPYSYNHFKCRNYVLLGLSSRTSCNELYIQFFRLCGRYLQHQYEHWQMRKQEEKQLQAIQELSTKKDEFISVASHELKTPLTSAKAFLQIVARSTASMPQIEKFVSGALKQLDRLQKLTTDLLDISKINAGKLDYKITELNFADLLQEAVSNFQSTVTTHQIEVEQNQDAVIEGDSQRLEQVLNNLLSNAVKYSPQATKVVVSSSLIQNYLVVAVRDFGVGIPQDRIHLLFERFYRIEETAMHFQGMGLGLFIVSEILNRHKGRFWIESEQGKGSTFYFMLPVKGLQTVTQEVDAEDHYSNLHISISINKEKKFLYVNWLGFQNNESVRQGCLKMLDMLKKTGLTKVLNDNRSVLGTWSDAAEWVGKEWFPMMEAAGLKHFAWIYSNSTFSQLSAHKSVDILQGKVVTRLFNDGNEGEDWLLKV